MWYDNTMTGVTYRHLRDQSSWILDHVASRRRHLKMFIYYTDFHNVDEDLRAITAHGGDWIHGFKTGIMARDMDRDSSHLTDYVASLKNKNSLSQ